MPSVQDERWRPLAAAQEGLLSRQQLGALGVDRFRVRNQIAAERWVRLSPTVVGTTTGPLSRAQLMWLGVLHAGPASVIGGLTAAEVRGLRNWHRDEVTVLVPDEADTESEAELPGIRLARTRRPIPLMRDPHSVLPVCRIEPAVLHWAAYQPSRRTAQGLVAAVVQQRLTTPGDLMVWVERLRPLRWARMFRQVLADISGGAQSLAEVDVLRMCRTTGLVRPGQQTRRRDADGRLRFTDCEWRLASGEVVVLEVDGAFHMEVEHWEDDLARQRALTVPGRIMVRCTARELRDEPHRVARDLIALGVPRRLAS